MAVPLRQSVRTATYLARQRLARRDKFPLLVELEPLFQCNLACAGCGKIQHPEHVLKRRMSVEQAVPEIDEIVRRLVERKRFVYLCTNALLMERKLEQFEPSPYFAWAVHLDGLRE